MTVITKLASSLGRRDEVPNQELAKVIAGKNDKNAVQELVENLSNKKKEIQSDCIKVIDEIGEIKPDLIAGYAKEFITLLDSKNNRLQWGAMTALARITTENPKIIYQAIAKIVAVSDKGSVITRDNCVKILVKLCAVKAYAENCFSLFIEQLLSSPTNQLPMYAELALPVINEKNKAAFIKTLTFRLDDIEQDTKRRRVEKVIAKVMKGK